MKQTNHQHQQPNGFIMGMVLGGIVGATALYALGTKNGRKVLRSTLDSLENIDELVTKLEEKSGGHDLFEAVPTVQTVIDKIQSTLPIAKEIKRYFSKDGKIIKGS